MPHTRNSVPIDHFRCYLPDHKDPRFNEYMTLPASWTPAEAHAAVDAVNNCDKRPFRSAWHYEAEIDGLKRHLAAIAKERAQAWAEAEKAHKDADEWKSLSAEADRRRAEAYSSALSDGMVKWCKELAGRLGIEPRRWTCDGITAAVGNLIEAKARAESLAKKHEQLDPQYGAAAEREKRSQLEGELRIADKRYTAAQEDNARLKRVVDALIDARHGK